MALNDAFQREQKYHAVGMQYMHRIRGQLEGITKDVKPENLAEKPPVVRECYALLHDMDGGAYPDGTYRRPLPPEEVAQRSTRFCINTKGPST